MWDYSIEIKAAYTYKDGITVIATDRNDADYFHEKEIKNVQSMAVIR